MRDVTIEFLSLFSIKKFFCTLVYLTAEIFIKITAYMLCPSQHVHAFASKIQLKFRNSF